MELAATIQTINSELENLYGTELTSKRPIFRVVWSPDQYEKRTMTHTDAGIELLTPEVRVVPKYKQWVGDRYVLERLVLVPDSSVDELAGQRMSYEILWVFETQLGVYLPPRIDVSKFVIDTMYAALGKKSLRKYVDEEAQNPVEVKNERIRKLQEEMFGNETAVGDALAYKTGVAVPHPQKVTLT